MSEQAESLVEQYEVGDETSVVETPVETSSATTTIESPRVLPPRDELGQFVKPITPDQNIPAHPAYLVSMAKKLGFSDEEIQGIPPETLGLAVAKVQETKLAEHRDASIERTHHEVADRARQTAADVLPQKDEFELPIEEYDDKLLGVLKRQDKELKALKAEIAQLRNVEINRQAETMTQTVDRLFSARPDVFGDGPGRKLDRKSPEYRRRMAILKDMETLGPGDIEDHFKTSEATLYPARSKPAEITPDTALEDRKEQYRNGGLARPTHRNGAPEPKGVSKARQSVAEALKEMGAADSEEMTSRDEFLGE